MNALMFSLATYAPHGYRYAARNGAEGVLLLAGLVFAGLLIWAIQRAGRRAV